MILIQGLRKSWPGFSLEIEQLEIGAGEYFVVLGPSGAGKTVLLSCLAGITRPDAGRIRFGDRDVTALPPERRAVGWVSQSNTLFPHLTVGQNIRFGRRYCGTGWQPESRTDCQAVSQGGDGLGPASDQKQITTGCQPVPRERFDQRAARLIALLELGGLLDRLPRDLSGGEIQRVMLARALALEPRVLLLDEPLRGLDPATQDRLCDELAQIHRELGTTTFHITHDHLEARALADRIAVVRDGRIEQLGTAEEVFERPATCFVARFTGCENLFRLVGQLGNLPETPPDHRTPPCNDLTRPTSLTCPTSPTCLTCPTGPTTPTSPTIPPDELPTLDRSLFPPGLIPADATHVAVRPEHVELFPADDEAPAVPPNALCFTGTVESLTKHGPWLRVTTRSGATSWVALLHPRIGRKPGFGPAARVTIAVAQKDVHFLP